MNSKVLQPAVALSLAIMLITTGCGYSDVSPRATEYAKAIYRITNLQKAEKIQSTRDQIKSDVDAGKLSSREAELLYNILDKAEAGKWESAMKNARSLMEAQVSRPGYDPMKVVSNDKTQGCCNS